MYIHKHSLNPLEYLPTLAPLTRLVELSVFNIHVVQCSQRPDAMTVFDAMPITACILRPAGGVPLKVCIYVCMYVGMYIYVCVCMYVYVYVHT